MARSPYHFVRMTNADPKFYPRIGPLLSRREIVAELGAPVWDDDGKTWIIALEKGRFSVIGFAAVTVDGVTAKLASPWVAQQHREQLCAQLIRQQLAMATDVERLTVTVSGDDVARYRDAGFKVRSKRGQWSIMERSRA